MIEMIIGIVLVMCLLFGGFLFLIGLALNDMTGNVFALIGLCFICIFILGTNAPLDLETKETEDLFVYESIPKFVNPTKECYYNGFTIENGETLIKCFGVRKDCLVEKLDLKNGLVYCKGKIINMGD